MSELTDLIDRFPNTELAYDDSEIYYFNNIGDPVTVTKQADSLLEDHFEGREVAIPHYSGDPALEESKTVSGYNYILLEFNGNYAEAFKNLDHE